MNDRVRIVFKESASPTRNQEYIYVMTEEDGEVSSINDYYELQMGRAFNDFLNHFQGFISIISVHLEELKKERQGGKLVPCWKKIK